MVVRNGVSMRLCFHDIWGVGANDLNVARIGGAVKPFRSVA